MSDFLKKVKSIFIVDDETFVNNSTKTDQPNVGNTTTPVQVTNQAPKIVSANTTSTSTGNISEKFVEVLGGALEASNLDGIDYFEFKQSLKSLEKMPLDEATRMQSAFAMAQSLGATPQKLIDSGQHYIDVLKKEADKFNVSLNNQIVQQVGGKENEFKQLASEIDRKTKLIEQLNQEIAQHKQRSQAIQSELGSIKEKITVTKNEFQATYEMMLNQIVSDIDNMKKYLK
ncbi:MAG: hypothetical protein KBA06_06130 [Saprospiraceae bacterium]|nr:hypothetical protein [Saprospiraceae bacterium]